MMSDRNQFIYAMENQIYDESTITLSGLSIKKRNQPEWIYQGQHRLHWTNAAEFVFENCN